MNEQGSADRDQDPALVARIIHAAIAAGLLFCFGVFLYLRDSGGGVFGETRVVRLVVYLLLGSGVVAVMFIRGRIPPRTGEARSDVWWTDNLPSALVAWAVAEALGMAAIVLGWLAGGLDLMVLGMALGLGLLFISRPRRLEGEFRL